MLAEYFDANVTVFERTGRVPFTLFRGIYDEDKIAVLTNLIVSARNRKNQSSTILA